MPLLPLILLSLTLLSPAHSVAGDRRRNHHDSQTPVTSDLVRTSCVHANYPNLCVRTLSTYSGPARTPRDLAQAAVNVSLARATKVSKYLARASASGPKRQRAALGDCVEQISDSVEELRQTLTELQHLRWETFRWQMSNAQTWVSAALTNDDTCLDGFQDLDGGSKKIKTDVKRKITNVARVTSNALYMINRLDETRRSTSP